MSELIADIRKPISEASPCGEDVRYEDDYGTLQAEVLKTAENDWNMVVNLGSAILAEQSKDLNVATWLCIGLLQIQGFDGLADGLEGYRILLQEYWDGLYPSSPRARSNALRMLSSRLGGDERTMGLIEARQATSSDAEALQRISETVKALNTEIQNKVPGALSLRNIADAVEDKLKTIGPSPGLAPTPPPRPTTTPPAEPMPTTPSQPAPATGTETTLPPEPEPTPAPGPMTEPEPEPVTPTPTQPRPQTQPQTEPTGASEWKTRNEAIDTIIKAAAFLRSQDPQDVTPYRLLRSIRWDRWPELPSDWRDNKAPFPLPQSERKAGLETLVKSEDWEALLKESEALFAEGNCYFWLDLQRYIGTALKGLGTAYDAVQKAVIQETAMFVERLPEVTEFSYRDNTAFADEETKTWIENEVKNQKDGAKSAEPAVVKQAAAGASVTPADATGEQKPLQPEVSDVQRIEVGGDGAKVEISIKVFTK